MTFHRQDGHLHCESVAVRDVIHRAGRTPFYLYSLDRVRANFRAYAEAAQPNTTVAYALKANANLHLLRHLARMGAGATLVSGGELELAKAAGFALDRVVFNGNGKTVPELETAIAARVLVNIDSHFDVDHIATAARAVGSRARVLLRANPDIDPNVHPYVSTGIRESKFGLDSDGVQIVLARLQEIDVIDLVGVHCHLGSTVTDLEVYRAAVAAMRALLADIRVRGFKADILNMGGGLGVASGGVRPQDLMAALGAASEEESLIVEPGRSIVGDAGVLVCRVVGVKDSPAKRFIVVDGSMTELIRPSLYGAVHPIEFVEPVGGDPGTFDVVGPVCESGDFLGRDRELPTPAEGDHVVVYEAGAYGYAMSSNYNARRRPAEYLVDGDTITCIRRAETSADLMRGFD